MIFRSEEVMGKVQNFETPLAEVFITEELQRRPPKKTDYLQEKIALQDLAARMGERPEELLPHFVDLAMAMTDGISAGLSLYEPDPAPGVFRWQYLRGLLAPFNGATTPRDFSPCGITLDQNAPVLSRYPERVYNWIADANITVPEVLLVPLYIDGKEPLGTLWIVSAEEGHFDSGHARSMTELAAFAGIALRVLRSEQRLQLALDEQQTLAKEMSHRVKNLFAITDGMIRISAREAITKEDLANMLSGRLHALAKAHALVRRSFGGLESVPSVSDLSDLIWMIVRPHDRGSHNGGSRFSVDGPSFQCGERATNGVALVVHELATNAVKYGALANDAGHVTVTWARERTKLVLRWVERGGPQIPEPPVSDGFGSQLAQMMVVQQFGGALDCDWQRAGLAVTMTLPLERLAG
jgi:two-component sensor histidine kinase